MSGHKKKSILLSLSTFFLGTLCLLFIFLIAQNVRGSLDLTEEKEFSLAPSTLTLLDKLEDKLTIKIYYSETLPPQLLTIKQRSLDLITELQNHSKEPITLQYINPNLNEDAENKTKNEGILPLNIDIIEKDQRVQKRFYMGLSLYYRDRKETIPTTVQTGDLEYNLAKSLIRLTQKSKPQIAVALPKSSERNYSAIINYLKEWSALDQIDLEKPNLTEKKWNAFILIEPQNLNKDFHGFLNRLIENGTHIMVFAGHAKVSQEFTVEPTHPNLNPWLKELGINLQDSFVMDSTQNARAPLVENTMGITLQRMVPYPFWVVGLKDNLNTDHPTTAQIENVILPWSHAFEIQESKTVNWSFEPLVKSSENAFLQPDEENPSVAWDYMEEMTQLPEFKSQNLVLLAKNQNPKFGKVYLTGSFHVLQNQFIQVAPVNSIFLQNLFEHASWNNSLIGIRSRGKTARPLEKLDHGEKTFLKATLIGGVPLFSVFCGLIVLGLLKRTRLKSIQTLQG